jgi:hypothetical protein
MNHLDTIRVYRHGRPPGLVQLFQGDLTDMPDREAVDVLVVSSFPRDYTPMPGALIGALYHKGLSVDALAADKEVDLLDAFSCWLSREIQPRPGLAFRRILCFEPYWKGYDNHPAAVVEELYQALAPFTGGRWQLTRVAMPVLAAGYIGCEVEEMAEPLVDTAMRWMGVGFPLDCVKIVCLTADNAHSAAAVFRGLKQRHAQFDVFISYCHQDRPRVDVFLDHLRRTQPNLSVFCDRHVLEGGDNWRERILQAVRSSSFFVPFYSPSYLSSEMCIDEFGTALMASQLAGRPRLFPVLLEATPGLPRVMSDVHYESCAGGGSEALVAVCDRLRARVTGA